MAHEGTFIFEGYETNMEQGVATFRYRVDLPDTSHSFREEFRFPPVHGHNTAPIEAVTQVFDALFLIAGISYWRLWCPRRMALPTVSLTTEQSNFWKAVYQKGLGELFYKNSIDFWDLLQFPATRPNEKTATSFFRTNRSLVLIGGGKDSIVTGELLRKAGKIFTPYALNSQPLQKAVSEHLGGKEIVIERILDPKLLELSKAPGVFNGHVPISVLYATSALLIAVLHDYRYIIASNERSANFGNVEYLGAMVNHQWSKSIEFESLFREYIHNYITPDITYFSLLRPLSEIHITKLFSDHPSYFSTFASCNRNFSTTAPLTDGRWCRQCAKCAFVFVSLAAFLPKKEVVRIFGANLLDDESLLPLYRDLLGLGEVKPFDCVGTPEEVTLAFQLAHEREDYDADAGMRMFTREIQLTPERVTELKKALFTPAAHHVVPPEFQAIVDAI